MRVARCALTFLTLVSCAGAPASRSVAVPAPVLSGSASPLSSLPLGTATPPVSPPFEAPPPDAPPSKARPCGAMGCLAFPTAEGAFGYVLQSKPRILAVGEAHAQQGTPGIRSSTRRFAEDFLPLLRGKAKHIVIELLVANCKQSTVAAVQKEQAPVTEHQAKGNQNEFLALGIYAKRLGIEPQALNPDCAEYEASVSVASREGGGAGASVASREGGGVSRLLELIATQTTKAVEHLLGEPDSAGQMILSYGGALHNDLYPRPGREAWSFGPTLAAETQGAYVELDLIVPEFVKDTEAWRNMPWFSAFDREHLPNEALLYRPAPGSFTLIFPKTGAAPK